MRSFAIFTELKAAIAEGKSFVEEAITAQGIAMQEFMKKPGPAPIRIFNSQPARHTTPTTHVVNALNTGWTNSGYASTTVPIVTTVSGPAFTKV